MTFYPKSRANTEITGTGIKPWIGSAGARRKTLVSKRLYLNVCFGIGRFYPTRRTLGARARDRASGDRSCWRAELCTFCSICTVRSPTTVNVCEGAFSRGIR
jgi:hypothetical protein